MTEITFERLMTDYKEAVASGQRLRAYLAAEEQKSAELQSRLDAARKLCEAGIPGYDDDGILTEIVAVLNDSVVEKLSTDSTATIDSKEGALYEGVPIFEEKRWPDCGCQHLQLCPHQHKHRYGDDGRCECGIHALD